MRTEPRGGVAAARSAMGNGDRNHDASGDASVDGWFDLLDEELEQEAAARPAAPGRASVAPVNLAGLNEISNKVTPVMLAPVNHLLPIEPSVAPEPARDAWDDDLAHDPFGGSLLSEPAANGVSAPPTSHSLPPLINGEDEHGQEFLEFGEAPSAVLGYGAAAPPPPQVVTPRPPPGLAVTPFGAEAADSLPPPREAPRSSHPPPTGRLSHLRRSRPPSVVSMPSMPAPAPSSPPRTPTLLGQSISVPPPPAYPITAPDEDAFDLSDFDRWGEDTPRPSTSVQEMFASPASRPAPPPLPAPPLPAPAPMPSMQGLFTDGSEFVSPPEHESFSEALTVPRLGPNIPSVSHARSTPDRATPAVRSSPPVAVHAAPTRPSGATSNAPPRRNSATMAWAEAPTPVLGTPAPARDALPPSSRRAGPRRCRAPSPPRRPPPRRPPPRPGRDAPPRRRG
ncbi:MAG: hypothetical protein U0324_11505 [Polyangiales bacterium]